MKKGLSFVLTAAMLFSAAAMPAANAAPSKVTVAGQEIEVLQSTVSNWKKQGHWNGGTEPFNIYLTSDAYEGSGAMLIVPPVEGTVGMDPTNYSGLAKKAEGAASYMVQGGSYKLEFYVKPLQKNEEGALLHGECLRYYDHYDVHQITELVGMESGKTYTPVNKIYTVDQDEWCKATVEFSFYDKDDRSLKGYGAAFFTRVGYPMIVDGVKLYQQYENGWRLVPEPYGVCNGDFEADLKGPEKVTAVNGLGGITLNWAMPSSTFKTNIYKDGVFAKEIPAGTNMARFEAADGIEAGKPYTFELRAVNGSGTESAGVSVKAMAYAAGMLDSYKKQFADWEFSNDPANGKIRLTTTGYSDDCALEFLDHQLAHPTWKPGIRNIRTSKGEHLTEGDIWRWQMWVKPTKVNIDGTYTIESIQTLIGGSTARTEFKTFTDAAGNPVNPKSLATDDWVLATSEERTIAAADKNNSWCTLLFASACIIDNISMEKKNAEGEWVAAPSNMVMNGSFRTNSDQEKPMDGVLTASAVNGTAKLSWSYSASGDVCGYQVLRDGELIATLSRAENSYEDSGLAEGVEYTYVVKAMDNCNNLSDGAEAKVVSVPVEYSVSGASVPEKVDEGENTVTVNVENFLISGGMKAELVLGLYKDGKLTNVQTSGQRVISKGAKVSLTARITAPALADGDYTVRVFVFDGISTLMPLSPVQEIQE